MEETTKQIIEKLEIMDQKIMKMVEKMDEAKNKIKQK